MSVAGAPRNPGAHPPDAQGMPLGRRWRRSLRGLVLALGLVGVEPAQAAEGEHDPAQVTAPDPPLPEGNSPRPRPDYRGREEPPPFGQHLLSIPRIMLAPLYVASDLVARPIAALAIVAEKYRWRFRLYDFFTFGANNQIGLFPTGLVDLGFRPSAGLYFFWRDIWRTSELRAQFTTGGRRVWSADASWRLPLHRRAFTVTASVSERPDHVFHGFGGDTEPISLRFGARRLASRLEHAYAVSSELSVRTLIGHEWWAFDADAYGGDNSLGAAIAAGRIAAPPALADGVVVLATGVGIDLDTRRGRLQTEPVVLDDYAHVSGSGFATSVYVLQHLGLRETRASSMDERRLPAWLTYGAVFTGTLDVTGTQRRLDLELYATFADPLLDAGPVPFTHLVSLGGTRPLHGFGARRLVDRSAAVATLRYRWPIWTHLDGTLHVAAGNVFGAHLAGFELPALRLSFGIGMAAATASDHPFQLLLALGTEPLRDGARVESRRLTAGTTVHF